jgi:nucleotide-binding universal stress UspA family protein
MRTIVVGVDGSDPAAEALTWSAAVAGTVGARLVAVHAMVLPYSEVNPQTAQRLRAARSAWLEDWATPLLGELPHDLDLRAGDPRDVLPVAAREHDADLLVVASTGATGRGPGFLALGSVAEYLAHHVERPLAIVTPKASHRLTRIVVGVDGSRHGLFAAGWVADLAEASGAGVVAVAVLEDTTALGEAVEDADPDTWQQEAQQKVVTGWAAPLARLGSYLQVSVTRDGPVAETLLGIAAREGADLLVVGARGLGGFTGLRAGGVALGVVHRADLPVVLVPPAPDDPQD